MDKKNKFKLKENEKVIKEIHHSLVIVAPHFFISFLILIFDFFLMYFLFQRGWWGMILFFAVILVVLFYSLRLLFLFYKNKLIVTNQRLIDFEQVNFFEQYTNEFKFSDIKDIKADQRGVWAHLFRFGTIKIVVDHDVAPYELYKISKVKALREELVRIVFVQKEKEQKQATDPVNLIMAEVTMLPREYKIKLYKRLKQELIATKKTAPPRDGLTPLKDNPEE
ncbi:hypothetical protein HN958_02295 [Candidatus Falkowbacteria bacterium]|jgi:hypothetical protein|nr:hypothetical protein [Candidatus Falkowbacteria bacterium]MBT7007314.1 hypothetical protein [Candidatus Falkowbacteria bacterium]